MALRLSVAPNAQVDPGGVPSRHIRLASACLGLLQHPCDWPCNTLIPIMHCDIPALGIQSPLLSLASPWDHFLEHRGQIRGACQGHETRFFMSIPLGRPSNLDDLRHENCGTFMTTGVSETQQGSYHENLRGLGTGQGCAQLCSPTCIRFQDATHCCDCILQRLCLFRLCWEVLSSLQAVHRPSCYGCSILLRSGRVTMLPTYRMSLHQSNLRSLSLFWDAERQSRR